MEQELINNGLSGIIILALGWVVMYLYKRQDSRTSMVESDLTKLRDRFDKYLEEDREEMLKTIRDNTASCHELQEVIKELMK